MHHVSISYLFHFIYYVKSKISDYLNYLFIELLKTGNFAVTHLFIYK